MKGVHQSSRRHGVVPGGIRANFLPRAEEARVRIAAAGMEANTEIRVCDYRDLTGEADRYDAVASVGMAEHVGREQLPIYFATTRRLLKPRGVLLNHAIGEGIIPRGENSNGSFIECYVFPDGDIPPLPMMLRAAESAGFEIRDVENLREQYGLTLRRWLRNLEARHGALFLRKRIASGGSISPGRATVSGAVSWPAVRSKAVRAGTGFRFLPSKGGTTLPAADRSQRKRAKNR